MTPAQQRDLEICQRGDAAERADAYNRLVASLRKWTAAIAMGLLRQGKLPGVLLEDAIQEGQLALCDAIARFDPARGIKFESFASRRVWGAMLDFLRQSRFFSGCRKRRCQPPVPLDAPRFAGDTHRVRTGHDALVDRSELRREQIRDAIDALDALPLDERQRLIVRRLYVDGRSLRDVGRELGVCESRICQLHSEILARLRQRGPGLFHTQ
jgi:RNA polymerase sigma factor for flagellar operon FliA